MEKDLLEFNNNRNGRSGKDAVCRACSNIVGKEQYAKYKDKKREYQKKYRANLNKPCIAPNCEGKSKDGGRYCSKHAQRLRNHGVLEIPNPFVKTDPVSYVCEVCSGEFYAPASSMNANRYCSWECYILFRNSDMKYRFINGEWYRSRCMDCGKLLKGSRSKRRVDCYKSTRQRKEPLIVAGEERIGYHALHYWVERNLGTPNICANCNRIDSKRYHWANISKEYKRDLSDWVRLCPRCHRLFDLGKLKLEPDCTL